MSPRVLETATGLAVLVGGALIAAVAWTLYQNPALGLLLGMARFCG